MCSFVLSETETEFSKNTSIFIQS